MPRFFYFVPPRALSVLLLIGGVIALALRFAFINHRTADRPAKRVWDAKKVIGDARHCGRGIIAGAAWQALRR